MPEQKQSSGSLLTVIVALVANALVALAKSAAAAFTGSAAMVAEAAHSWADTGNEVFLLFAERAGSRERDETHPRGYGRATYVWSLVAAFGLFAAGSVVSVWHGLTELTGEGEDPDHLINYVVLGVAFVLEGVSLLQATRQVVGEARTWGMRPLKFVDRTSDSTLRAVFMEDSAAIAGLLLAAAGIGLHELTGNAVFDALGSIAVGVLLGFVAIFLMRRNMDYLLGQEISPELEERILATLKQRPEINRVSYLHVEYVGPHRFFIVAAVDLTGDDRETELAIRLRGLEAELEQEEMIEDAVLTLAVLSEPTL
ncbi:cation diffusion facilitator family transporter [Nocardioides jensenii]|uniref:cation diffusion facilitator family transporter n=1 Tax=Nocardioides jensenii TaxID=1843 RepID=UPI000831A27E|nr:cation diffusion facilitator family transporter [Nocardioides jensenii]